MIESIFTTSTVIMVCLIAFFLLLSLVITIDNKKRIKNTSLKGPYLSSYQKLEKEISPHFKEYFGVRYALKRIEAIYTIQQNKLEPIDQKNSDTEEILEKIITITWEKRVIIRNIAFFITFMLIFFLILQTTNMLFAASPTLHVTPDFPFWGKVKLWLSSVSFQFFYSTHIQFSLFIYIIIMAFFTFVGTPIKRYYGSNINIQFGMVLLCVFAFVYLFLSIGYGSVVIFPTPFTVWVSIGLIIVGIVFVQWDRRKIKQDIKNAFPLPT